MNLDKISVGKNPPEEINVAIEIPAQSAPVKYELDKDWRVTGRPIFTYAYALSGELWLCAAYLV